MSYELENMSCAAEPSEDIEYIAIDYIYSNLPIMDPPLLTPTNRDDTTVCRIYKDGMRVTENMVRGFMSEADISPVSYTDCEEMGIFVEIDDLSVVIKLFQKLRRYTVKIEGVRHQLRAEISYLSLYTKFTQ